MRTALERSVRRGWNGEGGPAASAVLALATPLSWLYRAVLAGRNARYDASGGQVVEGLRVVSVGNLAVGGTGKTPLAAWVAGEALRAGGAPAVLARGYADEVALHRRWSPDVPVVADRDRIRGARLARARGASVAVLDDGFQHRRLHRDLDIVLLAAEDGLDAGLLPRGPFREPAGSLSRAHAVVVTRRVAGAEAARALERAVLRAHPGLVVGTVQLAPGGWLGLDGRPGEPPEREVLAVSSVGRPDAFGAAVRVVSGQAVEVMNFPDHHEYSAADVRRLRRRAGERVVVTTEKDAVKLEAHGDLLGDVRVLRQALRWERGEEEVRALVRAALVRGAP